MARRAFVLAGILLAAVEFAAGCGGPRGARDSRSSGVVTRTERTAFFNDWYADGRIDGVYPCAVVRDAIARLPEVLPIGSTGLQDFESYEKRVC